MNTLGQYSKIFVKGEVMWEIAGVRLSSRLFLGTGRYPSPKILLDCIKASEACVITVSLRRESANNPQGSVFWDYIKTSKARILPNTAGCYNVKDAVTTAHLARELFDTNWIKLEVIGNDKNLQPDPFGTCEAAKILVDEGFEVFPYTTTDIVVGERLLNAGCRILMPWAAPIGTGKGIQDSYALKVYRERFKGVPLILDAGIGSPSDACYGMELGYDGVLLNTAVAKAYEPVAMAKAFSHAVVSGRMGYEAGLMKPRETAIASSSTIGIPFWD